MADAGKPSQSLDSSEAEILAELLRLMQETDAQPYPLSAEKNVLPQALQSSQLQSSQLQSSQPEASSQAAMSVPSVPQAGSLPNSESLDSSLLELQRLLFNFVPSDFEHLRARLENPARRAVDLSEVLLQAIELHTVDREQFKLLVSALLPTVEQAIQESVQRDETVIGNALFPLIGPATRKAITVALENTVQSLDRLLEYSLSPRSLRWRLEAMWTRRPFAEIVLMRTLQFRVEQIFLIHRETGLLLQQVTAPSVKAQDPELVAAMLRAIDDFVKDSFTVQSSESLNMLRFGEFTIWLEQSPQAILAAMIRGQAPLELSQTLQQAIERIHHHHYAAIAAFQGDTTPFSAVRPQLEACLQVRYKKAPKKGLTYFWAFSAAVAVGLLLWGGHEFLLRRRWAAYVDRLQSEPGILVNRTARRWGGFSIAGLRDPLAVDPAALLTANHLDPEQVNSDWQPYLSLHPQLLLARAKQILQPPETVVLSMEQNGTLRATGTAPLRWIQEAQRLAPLIPGVPQFEQQVAIADLQTLRALQSTIEAQLLHFEEGDAMIISGQEGTIALLVQEMQKVIQLAARLDRQVQLEVIGRANSRGTPARNLALSQERANWAAAVLAAQGVNPRQMRAIGIGENAPLASKTIAAEQINRSVSFRLIFRHSANSTPGNQ